jgi:hypothetical protein
VADRNETDGFRRGYRAAQLERLGPRGIARSTVLPGAKYEFRGGHFRSAIRYEREVMANLRHLQMLRAARPAFVDLLALEGEVKDELRIARRTVDELRDEGLGRACTVKAMRASPQRPPSVREYPTFTEAVEEDPRRALPDWPAREDLSGADVGFRWSLENPIRRWETTTWRISWLEETEEVYAIELPDRGRLSKRRRVWILGKLQSWEAVHGALWELQCHAMDERNSLVVAAERVARAARDEAAGSL